MVKNVGGGVQFVIPPAYHRSRLTPNEQLVYREIVNCLLKYSSTIEISTDRVSYHSLPNIIRAVHLDHPELFYVNFWNYVIVPPSIFSRSIIRFQMMIDASVAKTVLIKMESCANSLRKARTTLYSTERLYSAIIREITSSVEYKDTKSAFWDHTAAGPVLHHTSVCEGIAKLFLFYCLRFGLPCAVITGTLNGSAHAWNMIEICGKRKHVDLTSMLRLPSSIYHFPSALYRSPRYMINSGYSWIE